MKTSRRTWLAGVSMALGGVLMMVPPLLGPPSSDNGTRARLEHYAHSSSFAAQQTTKSLIFQLVVLLLLPGVVAIVGRVRGRGTWPVVSGGIVYAAGIVGIVPFLTSEGIAIPAARSGPVTTAMVHFADKAGSAPTLVPSMVLGLLCFHLIGLPWLTFGMVRARMIPWWLASAATVGCFAAFFGSGTTLETVGWYVTGLALIGLGATVARPGVLLRTASVDGQRSDSARALSASA